MREPTRKKLLSILSDLHPKECVVTDAGLCAFFESLGATCRLRHLSLDDYEPELFNDQLEQFLSADLVILSGNIDSYSKELALQIIGSVRNRLNAKLLYLASDASPLSFNEIIGLGFQRLEGLQDRSTIFTYDITSYNKKREWNNSRFWANPENFNKYRW